MLTTDPSEHIPLSVSGSRSMHPIVEALVDACEQVGIRRNDDHNGAEQEGAGRF